MNAEQVVGGMRGSGAPGEAARTKST
jgi:hypothetical protein